MKLNIIIVIISVTKGRGHRLFCVCLVGDADQTRMIRKRNHFPLIILLSFFFGIIVQMRGAVVSFMAAAMKQLLCSFTTLFYTRL